MLIKIDKIASFGLLKKSQVKEFRIFQLPGKFKNCLVAFSVFFQASFSTNKDSYFTGRNNVHKSYVIFKYMSLYLLF
jgi:hypothetical protein